MIEPYQAVGLIQTMRGIRRREEISWNLEHISHLVKAASWLSSMDLPGDGPASRRPVSKGQSPM
jgi:hypothetical protein